MTEAENALSAAPDLEVDIVSDVVCPWCVIGYKQFEIACERVGVAPQIRWRSFLLNPDTPKGGRNIREHIAAKYGAPMEEGDRMRARLTEMGVALGFPFNFTSESRTWSTPLAHQLLHWADKQGRQHALKMAMFTAQFTDNRAMDDPETLCDIAAEAGLDRGEAQAVLAEGRFASAVEAEVRHWRALGVQSVPTFIFNGRHAISGAQPIEVFEQVLRRLARDDAAPGGG